MMERAFHAEDEMEVIPEDFQAMWEYLEGTTDADWF